MWIDCGFNGKVERSPEGTDLRFPCDHCDKMFLRKSLLEHKRYIVEKKSKVSCDICEKMFTRKRDLEYHKREKHETENYPEPVAQCENCSKKFSTKKNFDMHMLPSGSADFAASA